MKYATVKVKQTINACTETAISSGSNNTSVSEKQKDEGIETKVSTSWDTHMRLW